MDLDPDTDTEEARLSLRMRLLATRAALDGLRRDLDRVDRVLARMDDAPTNPEHPLHAFAVAVGPRFLRDGQEFRLAIGRLRDEIAEMEEELRR